MNPKWIDILLGFSLITIGLTLFLVVSNRKLRLYYHKLLLFMFGSDTYENRNSKSLLYVFLHPFINKKFKRGMVFYVYCVTIVLGLIAIAVGILLFLDYFNGILSTF